MLGSIEDLKVDPCNCYVVSRIGRQLKGEAGQHWRLCLGFQKKSEEDFHFKGKRCKVKRVFSVCFAGSFIEVTCTQNIKSGTISCLPGTTQHLSTTTPWFFIHTLKVSSPVPFF